jgi:uncharacterized membrane protein YedE/YeeE
MSVILIIIALVLGTGFGFALQKAGLTQYHKIVNVFRFTDPAVLKFMLTALIVAMAGLFGLGVLGLIDLPVPPQTYIVGNLAGGLVFGVGMSLVGI